MTVRRASTFVEANTTVTTTTETEAAQVAAPPPNRSGLVYTVRGWMQVTAGVGTTAFIPRIRRGTDTSGTLVGEGNPVTVVAGNTLTVPLVVDDTPGEVSSLDYVVTVQQTAATGNGTVAQASLTAEVMG